MVKPTPMFEITMIEVKPMEMPDIRCPNCKASVYFGADHLNYKYGANEPPWRCEKKIE
jgi:hypothetical protein